MHQSYDTIPARFTFVPERAAEFLEDGQLVTQIECESAEEVIDYLTQFGDAIADCSAIVNGEVKTFSDYKENN